MVGGTLLAVKLLPSIIWKSLLAKDDKARYRMSPQARARAEAMLDAPQRRSITNNTIAATGPGTAADALRGRF